MKKKIVFTMKQLNIEFHTFNVDESFEIDDDYEVNELYMDLEDKYGEPLIELDDVINSDIEDMNIIN
jgi:hypothetical protein